MKTFQQYNETMQIPLRTTKLISHDQIKHLFGYEGRSYQIVINEMDDYDGTLGGKKWGTLTFSLEYQHASYDSDEYFNPTGHNKGQFMILATVVAAMEDAFTHDKFDVIAFSGQGKLGKLYTIIAAGLKSRYPKYHIDAHRYTTGDVVFEVTKK